MSDSDEVMEWTHEESGLKFHWNVGHHLITVAWWNDVSDEWISTHMINVIDLASGEQIIARTREAFEAKCREWLDAGVEEHSAKD